MKFNEAKKIANAFDRAEKAIGEFPTIAGVEAVNFYTKNFSKQGFDDEGVKHWKERKRQRVRDAGRAILVKSGAFRRSLLKRKAGKLAVFIISPLKYARRHNEGLDGMPKRQVVGDSGRLNRIILRKIDKRIQSAFK